MAAIEPDKLLARAKKAQESRDLNRSVFEDCYDYLLPQRNTFQTQTDGRLNKASKLYSSAGMHSASNFVNTMQANFTPVFQRWAEFKPGPGIAEESKQEWIENLEDLTETVFTYLNNSNFATASAEMYFDWGIGTGALWIFEGDTNQPLNFISTPLSQYGLEEGRFGEVSGIYKETMIAVELIQSTFSAFNPKISENLARKIQDSPQQKVKVHECLYKDYDDMVWHYCVLLEEGKEEIASKTFKEAICLTPRWLKIPGSPYGVGPFMMAMPDIKTLNKIKELMLQNMALSAFGVYTVENNGTFNPNTAVIRPGMFIPVESNGGGRGKSIEPLPQAGNFQLQEFVLNALVDDIKKIMLDTKMPDTQAQPPTAFELAQRIKEFQQDIGSAYGRAIFEFVIPLFRRVVQILSDMGKINLPPNFDIDQFLVKVQVVSPIAQTQAMADVQRFMESFQMVASTGGQEMAMMSYNLDNLAKFLLDKIGGPAEMLRDEQGRSQVAQNMGAMMQSMQSMQGGAAPQGATGAAPMEQPEMMGMA